MWWFFIKHSDDGVTAKYYYGYQSKTLTGLVSYNREAKSFDCEKIADDDSEKGLTFMWPHLFHLVMGENAPERRMIATG